MMIYICKRHSKYAHILFSAFFRDSVIELNEYYIVSFEWVDG